MVSIKKKTKSRWYLLEPIIDVDYADDLALFALAKSESLLYNLDKGAG